MPKHSRLGLVAEADLRVALDVGDRARIFQCEEIGIAVEIDVAVVAHRAAGDCAALGARAQHREVDVAHLGGDIGQTLFTRAVGHRAYSFGSIKRGGGEDCSGARW
jgi:hypothetical protein